MSLQINLLEHGEVTIIDLWGRITASGGARELNSTVAALLAEGRNRLLLNLAAVHYIDSCGLGALVALHAKVENSGGSLVLVQPAAKVRNLLVLPRLFMALKVFDRELDAFQSFSNAVATAA